MKQIQILIQIEALTAQQNILYNVLGGVGLDNINEKTLTFIKSNIKTIGDKINKLNRKLN